MLTHHQSKTKVEKTLAERILISALNRIKSSFIVSEFFSRILFVLFYDPDTEKSNKSAYKFQYSLQPEDNSVLLYGYSLTLNINSLENIYDSLPLNNNSLLLNRYSLTPNNNPLSLKADSRSKSFKTASQLVESEKHIFIAATKAYAGINSDPVEQIDQILTEFPGHFRAFDLLLIAYLSLPEKLIETYSQN